MPHTKLPNKRIAKTYTVPVGDCDYHNRKRLGEWPLSEPSRKAKKVRLVLWKMPERPHLSAKNGKDIKRMCEECRRRFQGQYIYPTDKQLGVFMLEELK